MRSEDDNKAAKSSVFWRNELEFGRSLQSVLRVYFWNPLIILPDSHLTTKKARECTLHIVNALFPFRVLPRALLRWIGEWPRAWHCQVPFYSGFLAFAAPPQPFVPSLVTPNCFSRLSGPELLKAGEDLHLTYPDHIATPHHPRTSLAVPPKGFIHDT
jgi:hypothetical protein